MYNYAVDDIEPGYIFMGSDEMNSLSGQSMRLFMNKKYNLIICLFVVFLLLLSACSQEAVPKATASPSVVPEATPVTEFKTMRPLARSDFSYMTSANGEVIENDIAYDIPGFIDLVSFSKQIDDESITIYFELRELPDEVYINRAGTAAGLLEYSWRINFDIGSDGGIEYDITLAHHRFRDRGAEETLVSIEGSDFMTVAHQHQVSSGKDIAEGTLQLNGNTMELSFDKSQAEQLAGITEDTPFHILLEYSDYDYYLYELVPVK